MGTRTDTIAAIATAPGRGGVAVVRISGPEAWCVATRVTGRALAASDAGRFFHVPFTAVDDGLMLVFKGPHSYTGEDVVELQGHGGSVTPRRVLEAVLAAGARLARRGEFTERAFLNGRLDLSAAEAVIDLIDARTARAADEAFARLGGALTQPFRALYQDALDLSSQLEHALDFSEDELSPTFGASVERTRQDLLKRIGKLIATAREGRLLREGAHVVLAGAPNAGKSSLMNALLGEARVIVNAQAGTTRDAVEEGLQLGGWSIVLTDTAGLRETADVIEAEGVTRAKDLIAAADLVVALDCTIPNALHIHAKCDLDAPDTPATGLRVSAKTGEGLVALKAAIVARLEAASVRQEEACGADVTTRQKALLEEARDFLARTGEAIRLPDWVIAANEVRGAAESLGRLSGQNYSDDLLANVFARFCVGK